MADLAVAPVLPPELTAQQTPPSPAFMVAGSPAGDPISMFESKVQELERWASEMSQLLQVVHPPAQALLVPIAQAGKALQGQVEQLRQRMAGMAAGGGPPEARTTPAEGIPPRPLR